MESIDLELGELFDRDAVDDMDDGEDVGAQALGQDDEAAGEDGEGCLGTARHTVNSYYSHQPFEKGG